MADDDKPGSGSKREQCTLDLMTLRYLDALSKKGTHGRGVSKVMTTLIEQGVRQAILDGFIKQFPDEEAPG
jgi:hypothetical protein